MKKKRKTERKKDGKKESKLTLSLFQPQELREDVVNVLELWWASTLNLSEVFKLVRLPFPDLHSSALRLLTSLVRLPWGQRLVTNEPGTVRV